MADTNLDIIKDALRMTGAVDLRAANLSGDMSSLGLRMLVSVIRNLPGWTAWNEVEIRNSYTAYDDERITVVGDVTVTVTLPTINYYKPIVSFDQNGLTVKSGDYYKAPRDGARVAINAQEGTVALYYAYRSDSGKWITVHSLALTGTVPLNEAAHIDLSALVAEAVSPIIGTQITGELANTIENAKRNMANRYAMSREHYETDATSMERGARFY
jgi:hypothetical protein